MTELATSKNGVVVWLDSAAPHVSEHLASEPTLLVLVREAIANSEIAEATRVVEYDFGHPIGATDLVATTDEDDIVYARRRGRQGYTRFVKGRVREQSNLLTMVFDMRGERCRLWSAWIGPNVPSFPDSERASTDSRDFWAQHALVWGHQAVEPGSETAQCPW